MNIFCFFVRLVRCVLFFYLLKFLMMMLLDFSFFFTLVGTLNQLQIKYTLIFWREVNLNSHLWNETQAPAWSICWLKYHKHIIFHWKCWKSISFFHLNFMMSLISFIFLSHRTLLQKCISTNACTWTKPNYEIWRGRRGHRQTRLLFLG